MYEALQFQIGRELAAKLDDLVKCQFTCQHDTLCALLVPEHTALAVGNARLRTDMDLHIRGKCFYLTENTGIRDDQGIHDHQEQVGVCVTALCPRDQCS